jgi:preprotein translocase subunit SecD
VPASSDTETQLKAKDVIEQASTPTPENPAYVVALNLLSLLAAWLTSMHALPMYLGLDLRGGVHFLLQVDMKGALTKRLDATAGDLRSLMRDKGVRHGGITREATRRHPLPRRRDAQQGRARHPGQHRRPAAHREPGRRRPQAGRHAQARGAASASRNSPSSRTSPPCTTASTNWASPSR